MLHPFLSFSFSLPFTWIQLLFSPLLDEKFEMRKKNSSQSIIPLCPIWHITLLCNRGRLVLADFFCKNLKNYTKVEAYQTDASFQAKAETRNSQEFFHRSRAWHVLQIPQHTGRRPTHGNKLLHQGLSLLATCDQHPRICSGYKNAPLGEEVYWPLGWNSEIY